MVILILDFPRSVSRDFMLHWLNMSDICRFDSSMLNHDARKKLLSLLHYDMCCFKGMHLEKSHTVFGGASLTSNLLENYHNWLQKKQISVDHIAMYYGSDTIVQDNPLFQNQRLCSRVLSLEYRGASEGVICLSTILSNLIYLRLISSLEFTDTMMDQITNNLPNLQCLIITGCRNLTAVSMKYISNRLKKLETLHIGGCVFTDESFINDQIITNYNETLDEILPITSRSAEFESKLISPSLNSVFASLRELNMSWLDGSKIPINRFIYRNIHLLSFKSLLYLDLSDNYNIDNSVIESICKYGGNELKYFDISRNQNVSLSSVIKIAETQPNLTYLSFNRIGQMDRLMSKNIFPMIGNGLTKLISLHMNQSIDYDNVNPNSILVCFQQLPFLENLSMAYKYSGTYNATYFAGYNFLRKLSSHNMPKFKVLDFNGCFIFVNESDILALLSNQREITKLDVRFCNNEFLPTKKFCEKIAKEFSDVEFICDEPKY
eukprot:gene7786-10576_t